MRKYIFIILIAVLLIGVNIKKIAAAANIDRHTNSTLGIDLSVGIPIFYNDLSKAYPTNLYPGGIGAIKYQYHILNNLAIGLELRYMFNFDINHSFNILNPDSSVGKIFYSVPITFSINYIFDIGELFQIPVFTNIGFSLNTYGDRNNNITNLRTFDALPTISFGSGILWNFNYKWAFGATASWWMMFEFGNSAKMAHFALISLSVTVNVNKL
ncbi:hypothetical protein LRB59_03340 [Borreliella burgdorferi]|uniref:Outer membrane protein beta-barrel domain-containing protein n=1 Tax=Borreliella burgdorferi 118a TaxID=476210 RepID=A0A7U8F0H4_BORBG|nr:hypothetical protein [Borreliella burgdorferi]EOA80487.1 hypothetical protein BBUCA8_00140 [Borreliella burgdorferi CA8]ADQ30813.1 conserved hypothetical protein [Borreliella burgdorferi JD1]AXK70028.1 hypothetical protein BbuMM1_00280 [Borreliella burgdorferi]EEC21669.1 conserved hypothetical protein [Borreliella burgdorferi 156a]EEE18906.1 conserved hypothetical protein [Borreliella burgdorferi 72a]